VTLAGGNAVLHNAFPNLAAKRLMGGPLRFLGIGDDNSLAAMYLRLLDAGHEVRVFVAEASSADTLQGLLPRVTDWEAELPWVRTAGANGIILFETAHMGGVQDRLRRDGYNVIGGSAFGDRLEADRSFGQACMREAGMQTAVVREFDDFRAAARFIENEPGRYVFKLNGSQFASGRNYVGELDDGADVKALLLREATLWKAPEKPSFVLMQHLVGVEVGVGAYFNGERFMDAVCIDWEHKRFFNGDLGELTGEMGTLVSYRGSRPLFEATLARMAGPLAASGYVGYINLNTIVNDGGIWPLEFTCRFGYPGFAILDALHAEGWDVLFARMIRRETAFATDDGFAIGVVLTVPPFPYRERYAELSRGLPILFRGELSAAERRHLHFDEVELRDGQLVTSGMAGYIMVVTGCGADVEAARAAAYGLAGRVVIPNIRYRTDIGRRFIERDRAVMRRLGLWPG